jgi:hypothetical protein
MNPWRPRLLFAVLAGTGAGYLWLFIAAPEVRVVLALLTLIFLAGTGVTFWHYRARLTPRLFTANLAYGSIVHLGIAGALVLAARLGEKGLIPALSEHWAYLLVGLLGVGAAFLTWTRARGGGPDPRAKQVTSESVKAPEPPPPPVAAPQPPDWAALAAELEVQGDAERLNQLRALRRVSAALEQRAPQLVRLDEATRVVHQEAMRLAARSKAERAEAAEEDALSQAAELLEWGVQKLPELAELDMSDLMMGKTVADIRALHDRMEHTFIDHRELRAIHPIDRDTANEKCDQRAAAARAALPILEANGMRLSEELIAAREELAAFQSVTGFQVVSMGEGQGYVTFEGNGRREALKRAFGEERGVMVEVRRYFFDDPEVEEAIRRRVRRVRRWKNVTD